MGAPGGGWERVRGPQNIPEDGNGVSRVFASFVVLGRLLNGSSLAACLLPQKLVTLCMSVVIT